MSTTPRALRQDARGNWYRNLGYTDTGSQPKFIFGKVEKVAQERNARLQKLWEVWQLACETEPQFPEVWNECAEAKGYPRWEPHFPSIWPTPVLTLARAIAAGQTIYLGAWLTKGIYNKLELCQALAAGCITGGEEQEEEMVYNVDEFRKAFREERENLHREADTIGAFLGEPQRKSGVTIAVALDHFREHLRTKHRDTSGQLKRKGHSELRGVNFLSRHIPLTMDLTDFNLQEIDKLENTITKRPPTKAHARKGQPIAKSTAKTYLKLVD